MKIYLKVKPNAKENKVTDLGGDNFMVHLRAPAREGAANKELIKVLSEYFSVAKSRVTVIKGHKCRNKAVLVE